MQDLNENETDEEINQEVNVKVSVKVSEEVNQEANQVYISKVEPTKTVNNVVNNANLNKTVTNKQYDIFELIGLAIKFVNKNIGKLFMCFFKIILATLIFIMPIFAIMDIAEDNQGNIGFIITMVIIFALFMIICVWIVTKTITNIDTGIERIESKKSKVPMGTAFWRLFGLQFLMTALSFSMYVLVELTADAVVIYVWLMIQMQIFTFLLNNYTMFGYFEIVAKGENVSNSLANAFTNLFFSKNGIILKSIVGSLLFGLISIAMILAMVFSDAFTGGLTYIMRNVALANGIGTILSTVLGLIMIYILFVNMTYSYLFYMLNEVRDEKVGDLR